MKSPKLIRVTTIPASLNGLLTGQLKFLNQSFNVIGLSADGPEVKEIESREGISMKCIAMEREISMFKDFTSLLKLIKFFRKEKPDIVHVNTPKASLLSMIAAKVTNVPIRIYTVTGLRFQGFDPSVKKSILIFMERITCAFATHVIPEGNGVRQTLIQENITNKKLEVIGNGNINGIDTSYFAKGHYSISELDKLRQLYGILPDDFVFCFAGRLVIDKGITELVNAFSKVRKQFPQAKLLLLGPFEAFGNALPHETKLQIEKEENIITTGFVKDVRPYLELSEIFVFPSYREGFPNVVLQAGSMELPCIVTDINGSNEIIVEGKNGLIIPVKNEEALLGAMIKLLEDKTLLRQLKENSRTMISNRFEQRFVWDALLKRYNEYICEMKIGAK